MTCPDENHLSPPTDSELWNYGWVLSGFFALFAVTTSTTLMTLHLRHWTRPQVQRHILRILFIVPSYAICAFVAYKYSWLAVFVNVYRDCYEGFTVYAFFSLCLVYLGHGRESAREASAEYIPEARLRRFPPPMCCIIQLTLSRIATSTFTLITEADGTYCGGEPMQRVVLL
ncbi:organic solute transporter Ostalpha-domain-containing protein, partial [Chytridium lagenaria]